MERQDTDTLLKTILIIHPRMYSNTACTHLSSSGGLLPFHQWEVSFSIVVYAVQMLLLQTVLLMFIRCVQWFSSESSDSRGSGPGPSGQQVDKYEERHIEEDKEPQVQPIGLPRQGRRPLSIRRASLFRPRPPPPHGRIWYSKFLKGLEWAQLNAKP